MRDFYWSIRRELWEHRGVWIAPLAVAVVFLIGFLISGRRTESLAQPYDLAALAIMGATTLMAIFFSVDALYGERRDRSILFWKSMPVSDSTSVLSKAAIPIVILPLIGLIVTVALQWLMFVIGMIARMGNEVDMATLWASLPMTRMGLVLAYHLLLIHGLWFAPVFAWLLLVSAWARQAPLVWAVVPLFAIGVAERIIFRTSYFAAMLQNRVSGGQYGEMYGAYSMLHVPPAHIFVSAGLWLGLIFAAALLVLTVRLRRNAIPL